VVFQRRLGGGIGSERSGPWLDEGCVVCEGSWGYGVECRDGFDAIVDKKLAVSDIRRNFRGGMPVSAHRLKIRFI